MNWIKLEVFYFDKFIGSTYTTSTTKADIEQELNKEFGVGKWTRYYTD